MPNSFYRRFLALKKELVVPKDIRNAYGGFNYRSKENIQEKLKPLEEKHEIIIKVDDSIVTVNERLFTKSTAVAIDVRDGEVKLDAVAFAEFQPKDGTKMNESQLSGSSSSYAGKYALSNLLGLDDNKDSDSEILTQQSFEPKLKTQARQPLGKQPLPKKVQPELNVDNKKKELYEIAQESLLMQTAEEINKNIERVERLGGDLKTINVLETKAKSLGFIQNLKTKKWEDNK